VQSSSFTLTQQVTLNGSGYGFTRFQPRGESWHITYVSVSVATALAESLARVYQGPQISVIYKADESYRGSSGDTSDNSYHLADGDPLWIDWTGGDANAVATAIIRGTRTVGSIGFRAEER
jgi:hypothetical protein